MHHDEAEIRSEAGILKHATCDTLERLDSLLGALRAREALREKRPGVFYLKSRAFLHFHDDPAGLFCDVRLDADFSRHRVSTELERKALLAKVDARLASL